MPPLYPALSLRTTVKQSQTMSLRAKRSNPNQKYFDNFWQEKLGALYKVDGTKVPHYSLDLKFFFSESFKLGFNKQNRGVLCNTPR